MGEVTYWGLTGRVRVLTREDGRGYLLGRDAYWRGVCLLGRDSGRKSSSRLTRGWSSVYKLPKDGVDSTSSALSLDTGRFMLPFSKARRRPMDIPVFNNCQ